MIPRTRPTIDYDILKNCLLNFENNKINTDNNKFFLSSGEACLFVFLKQFHKKNVGVQVFTCPTVLDTILKAGHYPIFMDINKDYFTTTKDIIEKNINKIDILILTHLFGIPNPDYIEIKEICEKNNVIIIDDLCQTFRSKIKGLYLEDISSNYFYSFFSDKPISCSSGGMLKVSSKYTNNIKKITLKFRKQSNIEGKRNLIKLYNLYRLLSSDIYIKEFRTGNKLENYILERYPIKCSDKLLYKLLSSKLYKLISKITPQYSYSTFIENMSDIQYSYIEKRIKTFKNTTYLLFKYYNINKYPLPCYLLNKNIECSCSQRAIVKKEHSNIENAEIYLFNWPQLIDNIGYYPNANYVIKHYVNIPIYNF